VTLRRFRSLIEGLPGDGTAQWRKARRTPSDTIAKASPPPDDWWTAERDLLASVVDALNVLAWQKTKDGSKGNNPPKPIRRPGVVDDSRHLGKTTLPRAEVERILAAVGPSGSGLGKEPITS